MQDDPFERWRNGRPFGTFRQTDHPEQGLVPVPVVRDPAHRTYFASGFFAWSGGSVDGPRIQVSFDNLTKRRDVVFLPQGPASDSAARSDANDIPPPNSGTVQDVIVELCMVELVPSTAAQLARALIERLVNDAPEALRSVGLEFQAREDG